MSDLALAYLLGQLLFLLTEAALIIGGVALIKVSQERRESYPRCGGCGYDLTGAKCPECGSTFGLAGVRGVCEPGLPALRWLGITLITIAFAIVVLLAILFGL